MIFVSRVLCLVTGNIWLRVMACFLRVSHGIVQWVDFRTHHTRVHLTVFWVIKYIQHLLTLVEKFNNPDCKLTHVKQEGYGLLLFSAVEICHVLHSFDGSLNYLQLTYFDRAGKTESFYMSKSYTCCSYQQPKVITFAPLVGSLSKSRKWP